jgi:chemotaxis protein methyltransferase CheR
LKHVPQDAGYRKLKKHLIASTGLAFYADRDGPLTALIADRLAILGLRNCASYAEFLAYGEPGCAEMDVLIAKLTIGETYFFRDEEQFAAIRDIILPDILERKRGSKKLLIWSAGCATGAEPYSLAILLAQELGDQADGWQIGIHATDLNRHFLMQAAEGKFRATALRSTSDQVRQECFVKEGLTWTIHPRYKRWISFQQMNLMDSEFSTSFPSGTDFDLILCRNVMIYFSREVNRRLIGQFHQALGDGGWLVLGASESNMDGLKLFRAVNAPGTRLFQKTTLPMSLAKPTSEAPASRLASLPALVAPLLALAPAAPSAAAQAPTALAQAEQARADLDGLRELADCGNWQGAADYGKRLLSQNGLNAEVHFYHALIFEKLGIVHEPEVSLRHAIYLDRNFALAHYHLGLVLKRDGHGRAAERSFGNVLKILASLPDLAMVTAGPEITVSGLKELARMHLGGGSKA